MARTVTKDLIEVAFPLKKVSLDAAHVKNVRHRHICPARRRQSHPLRSVRWAIQLPAVRSGAWLRYSGK